MGNRPLLLVLDGHSTHYQPALIKYANENQVILLCLPPHTTYESQPLDAIVFKPFKKNWNDACHRFMEQNPGKVIRKYNFSPLLNEAWNKMMTPKVISAGFKRAGIYPFNPNVIKYCVSTSLEESAIPTYAISAASSEESMVLTDATSSQHPAVSSEDILAPANAITSQLPANFSLQQEQLFQKGLKRSMISQIRLSNSG